MITKRIFIACHNANGSPEIVSTRITTTVENYDLGKHYDMAKDAAFSHGYEENMVFFDEEETPPFMQKAFESGLIPDLKMKVKVPKLLP